MNAHVLAIDDSRTIRRLVQRALETAGFRCTTAEDGADGVSRFAEIEADVVITDLNMPRLDGFGVIEAICQGPRNRSVPILVLSTESADGLKARARSAGATGWIVKPFEEQALISLVRRVAGADNIEATK